MRQLDGARAVLSALVDDVIADRLGESHVDPGFTRLTDVVHDAGRAVAPRDPADVRDALPALAALREALEEHYSPEGIAKSPFEALRGPKATPYAAGALWATSTIFYATLARLAADEERTEEGQRDQPMRARVVEAFREHVTMRPADLLEMFAAEGTPVDKSVVSRCLRDLLEAGAIAPVDPPVMGDRRHRYYRVQDDAATSRVAAETARKAAWELLAVCDADAAKRLLANAVDEQAAQAASRSPA